MEQGGGGRRRGRHAPRRAGGRHARTYKSNATCVFELQAPRRPPRAFLHVVLGAAQVLGARVAAAAQPVQEANQLVAGALAVPVAHVPAVGAPHLAAGKLADAHASHLAAPAALAASAFLGALPPVDFFAVCFVRAIRTDFVSFGSL